MCLDSWRCRKSFWTDPEVHITTWTHTAEVSEWKVLLKVFIFEEVKTEIMRAVFSALNIMKLSK